MTWRTQFDYANSILNEWPDRDKAREAAKAIPKDYEYRLEAIELAFRQWRMWEYSNFQLPWVTVSKSDG